MDGMTKQAKTLWDDVVSVVKQQSRLTAAAASSAASLAPKVTPLSVLNKRIEDVQRAKPAVRSARQTSIFGKGNWYFLILGSSWSVVIAIMVTAYVVATCLSVLITMPCGIHGIDGGAQEYHDGLDAGPNTCSRSDSYGRLSDFEVLFWFSLTNLLNQGIMTPVSRCSIVVATIQYIAGIILNVLVFSIIVAKFLSPTGNLIFSKNALVTRRDGQPVLLIRVGNLRCNYMLFPEIRLSLHRIHRTKEGEQYIATEDLEVSLPSTISGLYCICHSITEASPLHFLLHKLDISEDKNDSKPKASDDYSIGVVIKAFDNVFQADLTAFKKYSSQDLLFNKLFVDTMVTIGHDQLACDFELFDNFNHGLNLACLSPCPYTNVSGASTYDCPTYVEDAKEITIFGAALPSTQLESGKLVHVCLFSVSSIAALRLLKIKYKHIAVHLNDKPIWFLEKSMNGETPLLLLPNRSKRYLQSSNEINEYFEELIGRELNKELLKSVDPIFPAIMALMSLKKNLPSHRDEDDFRNLLIIEEANLVSLREKLSTLELHLQQHNTIFLMGNDPSVEDALLIHKILVAILVTTSMIHPTFHLTEAYPKVTDWIDEMQRLPMYVGLNNWPTSQCVAAELVQGFIKKMFDPESISKHELKTALRNASASCTILDNAKNYFSSIERALPIENGGQSFISQKVPEARTSGKKDANAAPSIHHENAPHHKPSLSVSHCL